MSLYEKGSVSNNGHGETWEDWKWSCILACLVVWLQSIDESATIGIQTTSWSSSVVQKNEVAIIRRVAATACPKYAMLVVNNNVNINAHHDVGLSATTMRRPRRWSQLIDFWGWHDHQPGEARPLWYNDLQTTWRPKCRTSVGCQSFLRHLSEEMGPACRKSSTMQNTCTRSYWNNVAELASLLAPYRYCLFVCS